MMDATTGFGFGTEQASPPDLDALYAEFLARAKALTPGTVAGADALIADVVMSDLSPATFKSLAAAIATATGLDADELKKAMIRARNKLGTKEAEGNQAEAPHRSHEELEAACARILGTPDVLRLLWTELPALGIAGPGRAVIGGYVAAQSRHQPKPINIAIAGPSGMGKSYELETALRLVSPLDIYKIGDGSEKFFVYDSTPLIGKVIYFIEATPLQRDSTSPLAYAMRTLMTEGVSRYQYVDFEQKDRQGRPTTRELVRPGPAAVALTSTADKLHPEIETRLIRFTVDSSATQTGRILHAIAQGLDTPPPDALVMEWQAFDELLARFGTTAVVVPFGDAAVTALETKAATAGRALASRLRRDLRHVLTVTMTVGFLNQAHRQRDAAGRVIAEQVDWEWAAALLDPGLGLGALRALPPSALTVFAELARQSAAAPQPRQAPGAALDPDSAPSPPEPSRELAATCGMAQPTALAALQVLVDAGCLRNITPLGKGKAGRFQVLTPPVATGHQTLPSWVEILATGWTP